jgi:hypothetical protein
MRFPLGWKVGETPICQICIRENVESHSEEYFGCVGEKECSVCHRKVCQIHFSDKEQKCTDCYTYVNPRDKK